MPWSRGGTAAHAPAPCPQGQPLPARPPLLRTDFGAGRGPQRRGAAHQHLRALQPPFLQEPPPSPARGRGALRCPSQSGCWQTHSPAGCPAFAQICRNDFVAQYSIPSACAVRFLLCTLRSFLGNVSACWLCFLGLAALVAFLIPELATRPFIQRSPALPCAQPHRIPRWLLNPLARKLRIDSALTHTEKPLRKKRKKKKKRKEKIPLACFVSA